MDPDIQRNIGDERVSPAGRVLKGKWNETYVGFELDVLIKDDIVSLLQRELKKLQKYKSAFEYISETGGNARCYILATPMATTFGEEIPWEVLLNLSALRLSLCLEIYQTDE